MDGERQREEYGKEVEREDEAKRNKANVTHHDAFNIPQQPRVSAPLRRRKRKTSIFSALHQATVYYLITAILVGRKEAAKHF